MAYYPTLKQLVLRRLLEPKPCAAANMVPLDGQAAIPRVAHGNACTRSSMNAKRPPLTLRARIPLGAKHGCAPKIAVPPSALSRRLRLVRHSGMRGWWRRNLQTGGSGRRAAG